MSQVDVQPTLIFAEEHCDGVDRVRKEKEGGGGRARRRKGEEE